MPRILPLVGLAAGGVLAINALAGARDLPELVSGARAFAEEAVKGGKDDAKDPKDKAAAKEGEAATGEAKDAAATLPPPAIAPKPVCAPTAAELAKQAGLSPAELQVLQSLGDRRGQLDKREDDLNTQLALMAAAEAKLDAKIKALNGLKGEVQGLLTQAETKEAAEIDRLVKVFEGMKAKDAAPRFTALDESVRLPIAAKMKERSLSAIMAQMPAAEAKKLTEGLAKRFTDAQAAAAKAQALAQNGPQNEAQPPVAKAPQPRQQAKAPAAAPPAKAG
ncbi:MotE family protein [Phenylobacterium sp.]|uniref:MotE family protein n=1 Tax=Phenylobacterium sp. TaxID=1871053 RepID=UPI003918EF33